MYCLQSESTLVQEKLLINKSAQDGLYMNSVKELVIPFVGDIQTQISITDYLDKECKQIGAVIETKQQQLELMQQHKKSLIYEYVTGKKRVKEAM